METIFVCSQKWTLRNSHNSISALDDVFSESSIVGVTGGNPDPDTDIVNARRSIGAQLMHGALHEYIFNEHQNLVVSFPREGSTVDCFVAA